MSATLLDSTVLIDVLRNRADAVSRIVRLLQSGEELCTSALNVEEVVRGIRGTKEQLGAENLFAGLVVIPIDEGVATTAGRWRREFSKRGVTLSQADCLVAGACAAIDARLATGNPKDFPMREIEVDHWPVGGARS